MGIVTLHIYHTWYVKSKLCSLPWNYSAYVRTCDGCWI